MPKCVVPLLPNPLPSFVLVALADVPEVGAVRGDSILVRPGQLEPVVIIHRPSHATYGELAGVVSNGRAECPTFGDEEAIATLDQLAARSGTTRILRLIPRGGGS